MEILAMIAVVIVIVGGVIGIIEGIRRLRKPKPPPLTDDLIVGNEAVREFEKIKFEKIKPPQARRTASQSGMAVAVGSVVVIVLSLAVLIWRILN